jgi:hypothetical protein
MKEWFYSQFGQTKGPVSLEEVVRLMEKQDLELDSYVTDGMDKPWKKIKDIPVILDKLHEPKHLPTAAEIPANFMSEGGEVRIGNVYFFIPLQRLVLMTIASFGLYQLYWMYKQWQYCDRKHRSAYEIWSRGGMAWLIFPWTIFQKIQYDTELNAVERADFSGVGLFWLWAGAGMAIYLVVSSMDNLFGKSDLFYYGLGSLDVLVLLPIQRYINRVNAKLGNTYEKPGLGHYLCLGIGIFVIASTIIGSGIKALLTTIN